MVRIWLNHWFSTAYNIINLIKENEHDFYVIGTNDNIHAVYKNVCDEWYVEPVLKDEEYVEFCLSFCKEHSVDIFMPRRGMLAISKNKSKFESIGVKVMVDDFKIVDILNHKTEAYELFSKRQIGYVPDYRTVTNVNDFLEAYEFILDKYKQVCFKFIKDEGGKSYRLIDNNRKGYAALFKKQNTRMTLSDVVDALSERDEFSPIIVMPFLPGDEVSVDCLKTDSGIVMLPRVKDATRVEKIKYDSKILEMCEDFYAKIGLECPCNIQFKYLDDIPFFLEVNTRMSGGIQMSCLASGVNIPNLAVNKLLGRKKEWNNSKEEKCISHVEVPMIV